MKDWWSKLDVPCGTDNQRTKLFFFKSLRLLLTFAFDHFKYVVCNKVFGLYNAFHSATFIKVTKIEIAISFSSYGQKKKRTRVKIR